MSSAPTCLVNSRSPMGCCPPGWEYLPIPSVSARVVAPCRFPRCRWCRSSRRGGPHRQTSASCDDADPSDCRADGTRQAIVLHNCARHPVARSHGAGLPIARRPVVARVDDPATRFREIARTRSSSSNARNPDSARWVRPATAENVHHFAQRVTLRRPRSTRSTEGDRRTAEGLRRRPAWAV